MNWIRFAKLALQFKKALEDSKIWYPPVCMICRADWTYKDGEMVQCASGHIFTQPKHNIQPIRISNMNKGEHRGAL